MSSDVLLFVYGTLRPGEPEAWRLGAHHSHRPAVTTPEYTLIDLGAYPAMAAGGRQAVTGDLVAVSQSTLAELDGYEGALYERAQVRLADGGLAIAYLVTAAFAAGHSAIVGGDWTRRPNGANGG